nr:MAG TPA: hypothetical protein [Caudoviricetes sp.]
MSLHPGPASSIHTVISAYAGRTEAKGIETPK